MDDRDHHVLHGAVSDARSVRVQRRGGRNPAEHSADDSGEVRSGGDREHHDVLELFVHVSDLHAAVE